MRALVRLEGVWWETSTEFMGRSGPGPCSFRALGGTKPVVPERKVNRAFLESAGRSMQTGTRDASASRCSEAGGRGVASFVKSIASERGAVAQ